MHKSEGIDYSEERKFVSELFIAVLTKSLSVKEALLNFPKSCDDPTLTACWHALCHLEADEDIRVKDKMFADEQDEYIEFIAYTLKDGGALPGNVINSYLPYHGASLISEKKGIKGIIRRLKRFLCC